MGQLKAKKLSNLLTSWLLIRVASLAQSPRNLVGITQI